MTTGFAIAGRRIGPGEPVYIIAELSANHAQDYDAAVNLVHAAARAGADAVKLQTYTPDTITIDSDARPFRHGEGSLWAGTTLYDLYKDAYTPWEWHAPLFALARELGLDGFSSPFDPTAVAYLEDLGVPAYKVASFELVDLPLIRRMAETGKPLVMSTGMATEDEVDEAVVAARGAGAEAIALLKCTSSYPAPPESVNLRTISWMSERWGLPVGFSDHTLGYAVPAAAVALGASIVEKHITRSHDDQTPDAAFSLDEADFAAMVQAIRTVERAMGEPNLGPTPEETESRRFRRSLFVVEDVAAGEVFTARNVRSIRPAAGMHTREYEAVLGRRAATAISRGTPLSADLLEPEPGS
jgi:pseudaminic acid synthase